ncbi:uncharacterized protein E0L32_005098 [Thyridium curvatum]|uniref:Uncharacterized protein n=1 Tax=Thyridium curvatum TaxID=1093900 RepID=A0A507B4E9_9PEZI|nr:uncharacterized protein E0L32_005098 [Thyridium curvatum]TPX14703.1 hypothetical protein E0L32_005098 [Thyridium curvatum]
MSQQSHPMIINLPQPPSNPDTPSEMPGTPTSTTTSLSALSTTAIKDGHRGHALASAGGRGHGHHASTNSLEAERADRISRLAGLSTVSTLRPPHGSHGQYQNLPTQTTPTSSGFPAGVASGITPAYFDAQGQPIAPTKMSTVGTASATESVGGRTLADGREDDQDMPDNEEDLLSMDTNYRETEMDSASGYLGAGAGEMDPMDEDLATRSVGGFDDRMSDDGSASLVGFGEGAGSTVSGPIYHRRPIPAGSSAGAMANIWGLERSSSGLSEGGTVGGQRRDTVRPGDREGGETPVSINAAAERREARMMDGIATDGGGTSSFVDTTARGPIPVGQVQPNTSAVRETQQPSSHQQLQQQELQQQELQQQGNLPPRDAAERILRDRLDEGEAHVGDAAMGSPGQGGERLGKFYFEGRK